MDNVIENDKAKTKELFYDALLKLDNDYYIAIYPTEKLLICLWLREFNFITSEVIATDSASAAKVYEKVKPSSDQLYQILIRIINKDKEGIAAEINSSASLSTTDKEFLLLLLTTYTTPNDKKYQDNINSAATTFIQNFPHSKYEGYVRSFMRYEYAPKGLQVGFEYYGGATFFSGNTTDYFKSNGTFGLGIIWGIGKFQINTRAAFVFSRLKNDISSGGVLWHDNERAQIMLLDLSVGYPFQLLRNVSISPIIGVGGFTAMPYENDKKKNTELNNVEVNSNAAPLFGVDFCFHYRNFNYYNYIRNKPMFAFYSCNVRYTVQPNLFPTEYKSMNGLSHSVTISFKFGFGKTRRVL